MIYLKSGTAVAGKIVGQTNEYIQVDTGTGIISQYRLDEVGDITGEKLSPDKVQDRYRDILRGRMRRKTQPPRDPNQTFRFQFNPPSNFNFETVLKHTVIYEDASGMRREDVSVSKSQMNIERTSEGFTLVNTPVSTTMTRNSVGVADPLLSVLQHFVVKYYLDSQGRLTRISGYDDLVSLMKKNLSPEDFQKTVAVFSQQTFEEREQGHWKDSVEAIRGKEVKIGETWDSQETYFFPEGEEVVLNVAYEVVGQEACGRRACLKLRLIYGSTRPAFGGARSPLVKESNHPERATNDSEERVEGLSPESQTAGTPQSLMEITGNGIRFIDPLTMLTWGESDEKRITFYDDKTGEREVKRSITDKREQTFHYPDRVF